MDWAGKQHPVEAVVEWLAPVPLGLAVGWASLRIGLPAVVAAASGVAALVAGLATIKLGGSVRSIPVESFEPLKFEPADPDELVLQESDAILELDDPLEDVAADARVVRLFEREDPTPGELVDRIALFLGEGRQQEPSDRPAAVGTGLPDASAALHDALANIRASLR